MWEDLHENHDFEFLLTGKLNQDPIENLFATIREQHGCNETPNVFQFITGLKHILVGKLFKLSSQSNCESDRATILTELKRLPVSSAPAASAEDYEPVPIWCDADAGGVLEVQDVIQDNVHFYIPGVTVKQIIQKSTFVTCPQLVSLGAARCLTAVSILQCSWRAVLHQCWIALLGRPRRALIMARIWK